MPDNLAVEIKSEQTSSAKVDIDSLAISDGGRGRVSVFEMGGLRSSFGCKGLPEFRAVGSPESKNGETSAGLIRRGNKDSIAPHNRRRVSSSRNGGFPKHVFRSG